jgi:transposase-like protein
MSEISITEASRRFGVVTNTIRKRVREGRLTPRNRPHGKGTRMYFDVSDLVMVFGEPTVNPSESHNETNVQGSQVVESLRSRIHELELEVVKLRADLNVEVQRSQGKDREIGLLERNLRTVESVLTNRLESPQTFWERLRGKKKAP